MEGLGIQGVMVGFDIAHSDLGMLSLSPDTALNFSVLQLT
jgi:hypothetical protein